ncbi:MAG: hypothetical protein ACKVT2_03715 [Saprospiraceae bacterium]
MSAPCQQRPIIPTVLLTVLIAFQSVGWLLAWQGMLLITKIEAHQTLAQGGSTVREMIFHKNFIEKSKVGKKEILVNGQLFDFRILSETDDSLRVVLYHDQHEEALLTALGQVFKSEDSSNFCQKPVALWLAQWLGSAFLMPENPLDLSSLAPNFQAQIFSSLFFVAQSAPGVFVPPPEA